ncbi:MAG: hypothetical protein KDI03_12320 [Anaerolineae bacterium]|nr:hypothetical protein [Anaerolineae bacterium]
MKVQQSSYFNIAALKLQRGLSRWGNNVISLAFGYFGARLINELSVPDANMFDALIGMFGPRVRPANWLSIVSLLVVVAILVLRPLLARHYAKQQYDHVIADLLQNQRSPDIAHFAAVTVGSCLSLQLCPNMSRGWVMAQVKLQHDTTQFSLPPNLRSVFEIYYRDNFDAKRFFDDQPKLMLTQNPKAFTDSPTLILKTCETRWSHVQFYKDNIATSAAERQSAIRALMQDNIVTFAHSLSLHLIVETSDHKTLITQRTEKGDYYPAIWSCSLEEQASLEDIEVGDGVAIENWAKRALLEELGLGADTYNPNNIRLMAVFLESDILNISVCGHVRLDIDERVLDSRLQGVLRPDYEFTQWCFLNSSELLSEMRQPKRPYHPTARYRMLMAYIRQKGEPSVARDIQQWR